jgi:hypothetical protein
MSNLKSYLADYSDSDDDSSSDTETSSSVFSDYTTSIAGLKETIIKTEVNKNGKTVTTYDYTVSKKDTDTVIRGKYQVHSNSYGDYDFDLKVDGKYPFRQLMFDNITAMTSEKAWKLAYNEYLADIKENYSYKDLSGDEWFMFELNRVYEILRDNYIVEKYEDIYNKTTGDVSGVSASAILKAYSQKVRTDYTNYVVDGNLSSFESSVLSDISSVDYIVEKSDNAEVGDYFYLAPIKITVDGLSDLTTSFENGEMSYDQYLIEKEKLFDKNKAYVTVRNATTGEAESTISVNKLYELITNDLSKTTLEENESDDAETKAADLKAYEEKQAAAYRKYFYLYNDDDTYKNADYNAVFGVSATGEALMSDDYSGDAISEAVVKLYNNGNAKIGDISDIVESDDGYYIFFYAGKVENIFNVTKYFDASTESERVETEDEINVYNNINIKTLASTKINIFSSKTLLDVMYDELVSDNFSVFQNMNMNSLRSNTKSIEIHTDNIKDLY